MSARQKLKKSLQKEKAAPSASPALKLQRYCTMVNEVIRFDRATRPEQTNNQPNNQSNSLIGKRPHVEVIDLTETPELPLTKVKVNKASN